jgi:hypothetical protein
MLHSHGGGWYKLMSVTLQGGRRQCYIRPAVVLPKAGDRATSVDNTSEVFHRS